MVKRHRDKPPNYLRAWRERAGLTQGQLAERVGASSNMISQLETGARGLTDKWLYRLAAALGTRAGHILDNDPDDVDAAWLTAVAEVDPQERPRVAEILKAFKRIR